MLNLVIKKKKPVSEERKAIGLKMHPDVYKMVQDVAEASDTTKSHAYLALVLEALEARGFDVNKFVD